MESAETAAACTAVGSHVEGGNDRIKVLQLDKPRSKRVVGEVRVNTTVEQVLASGDHPEAALPC